jgi:SAM-dependent methyltransferase
MRQNVIRLLKTIGLYESAHTIWLKRPDIRLALYNFGYRLAGATDGLPIPPTRLIKLVQINGEIAVFLRGGALGKTNIYNSLLLNGYHIEEFEKVLDLGCGCGRILRHWNWMQGPRFYGTDINPDLIHWCQAKLSNLAEFKTNKLVPPLEYPDEYFDFVYSISVFTHLSEHLQKDWMRELRRVLKKEGVLLITVHGKGRIYDLEPEGQDRFNKGELVVKYEQVEGSNLCGAYHPETYVRNHLAEEFEVVDFIPNGATDMGQDLYIFRKVV